MAGSRKTIRLETAGRNQMIDLTGKIQALLPSGNARAGRVTVFVPHTTAGVTINEHADPSVAEDILNHLDRMVPWEAGWRHGEGNSAAHVKASLVGSSVVVPVEEGRLCLGTWQGVFFCEFDGPRRRDAWVFFEAAGPEA